MKEKIVTAISGWIVLALLLSGVAVAVYALTTELIHPALSALVFFTAIFVAKGFIVIYPNQSKVMTFFGKYVGTLKENGFSWVNPLYSRYKISLRARNFDSERVKVNDKRGNPILISVILVWKVDETYKAAFDVSDYESFVKVQTDAAVRKLAGTYSYDNFDDDQEEITLRSDTGEVSLALEKELDDRLAMA